MAETRCKQGLLAGRVALVTGAASGIGRSTTLALAREGAKVALVDTDLEGCRATMALTCCPEEHLALRVDITDPAAVDAAVRDIQTRYGQPADVVVNSAGVGGPTKGVLDLDLEELRSVFRVNLEGTFLVMRACGRALREAGRGGSVVNLSSMGMRANNPGRGHYAATKSAVSCLTRTAAKEWGPLGIRCNSVLPGVVDTPMATNTASKRELCENYTKRFTALQRMGQPEEIAEVIVFLASDQSSYMTGADIPVSGGI